MKKIFLLFGVAAFSSAMAQQKELFDIQKHIQKIQAEGKIAAEKKNKLLPPRTTRSHTYYMTNKPELSYTLPNGDRVVVLGQDNMPCIVPDMTQFNSMPNAHQGSYFYFGFPPKKVPGQIPNAAPPFRIASK